MLPAIAQKPGDSRVSGHCGEKKHRGLAVLVGPFQSNFKLKF